MQIKVLGSHGSDLLLDEAENPSACRCVGFLVDRTLLIDPGTGAGALTLNAQLQLKHILLSHAHFDHFKGLPAIADNLVGLSQHPLVVSGMVPVLRSIRTHIFNDQIFPDFFQLPTPEKPVLSEQALRLGSETPLEHIGITPFKVNHTVPSTGFLIRDQETSFVFSGDTHETDALWNAAKEDPHLKAAFIETSFPDEMLKMAVTSRHLTPGLLAGEFKKIGRPDLPLYIYHMKPRFRDRISSQLGRLKIPNLHIVQEGDEITL